MISAVTAALSLIETGAPELAEEIRALTREIILVDPATCSANRRVRPIRWGLNLLSLGRGLC